MNDPQLLEEFEGVEASLRKVPALILATDLRDLDFQWLEGYDQELLRKIRSVEMALDHTEEISIADFVKLHNSWLMLVEQAYRMKLSLEDAAASRKWYEGRR